MPSRGPTPATPTLHVRVGIWVWKKEAGMETRVRRVEPATGEQQGAGVASGWTASACTPGGAQFSGER